MEAEGPKYSQLLESTLRNAPSILSARKEASESKRQTELEQGLRIDSALKDLVTQAQISSVLQIQDSVFEPGQARLIEDFWMSGRRRTVSITLSGIIKKICG
ncbi:MAG: hypothetical protein PHS44_04920 [Candidatus Dojkabacteria bacterium]|jgi:hypothetical protein|nr:hypothetical protein [Candidatus Dojkabacteria bacterium]